MQTATTIPFFKIHRAVDSRFAPITRFHARAATGRGGAGVETENGAFAGASGPVAGHALRQAKPLVQVWHCEPRYLRNEPRAHA